MAHHSLSACKALHVQVEWLRGSHLHQVAGEIRGAARASWEEMQPLLRAAEQQGLAGPSRVFTREALAWAFSMLLSRLIRLPGLDDMEALVPWAGGCGCLARPRGIVLRAWPGQ
jgi:hypothetical protein